MITIIVVIIIVDEHDLSQRQVNKSRNTVQYSIQYNICPRRQYTSYARETLESTSR